MRVATCDNHHEFLVDFRRQIRTMPEVSEEEIFADSNSLLEEIFEGFDLIFINADWGGKLEGLKIAKRIHEKSPYTKLIFLMDRLDESVQYLFLENLNIRGILVKPVEERILKNYIQAVQRDIKKEAEESLLISIKGRIVNIRYSDISHVESKNHIIEIYTKHQSYKIYEPLAKLENRLPEQFIRCHRSFIINLEHVMDCGKRKVVLYEGNEIPIGRMHKEVVNEKYHLQIRK